MKKFQEVGGLVSDRTQRAVQDFTAWNTIIGAYETLDSMPSRSEEAIRFAIDIADGFNTEVSEGDKVTCRIPSLTKRGVACGLLVLNRR